MGRQIRASSKLAPRCSAVLPRTWIAAQSPRNSKCSSALGATTSLADTRGSQRRRNTCGYTARSDDSANSAARTSRASGEACAMGRAGAGETKTRVREGGWRGAASGMTGAAKAATHAVEHHVRHALGLKQRAQRIRVGLVPHVRRHRRVQDDDLQLARRSVSHFLAAVARGR